MGDSMTRGPEGKLQDMVLKFLRSKGAWCMKVQAGPGVPKGTADIFFCKEGAYGFIEVKAHKNSPYQVGQKEFLAKMSDWSWAKAVCVENWPEVKKELTEWLK